MTSQAQDKAAVEETEALYARVPVDLANRLRRIAERDERTVSAEIRRAIRAHVDADHGPELSVGQVKTVRKAERLRAEGRIAEVEARVYRVEGDHDIYTVVIPERTGAPPVCSCPSTGVCSHLVAAFEERLSERVADHPLNASPLAVDP